MARAVSWEVRENGMDGSDAGVGTVVVVGVGSAMVFLVGVWLLCK